MIKREQTIIRRIRRVVMPGYKLGDGIVAFKRVLTVPEIEVLHKWHKQRGERIIFEWDG